MEALQTAVRAIDELSAKRPYAARYLSGLIFGDPDYERLRLQGLREAFDKMKNFQEINTKKAQEFRDRTNQLSRSLEQLKIGIGSSLLPTFSHLVDEFTKFTEGESGE